MTHARIRAAQGDVSGARRVLDGILRATPDHAQALSLLAQLQAVRSGRTESGGAAADRAPSAAGGSRGVAGGSRGVARTPGPAPRRDPVSRRRIQRLRSWLGRVTARGGTDDARPLVPPRGAV